VHRRGGGARRGEQDGGLVNLKAFFVATLSSALDLGIAVPDDVVRHVTPDILAAYLPRPLWARLLTACVGAPRVDSQLVVETIGVPNLCEHVPAPIIWACIEELAQRSLGGVVMAAPVAMPSSRPTTAPTAPVSRPVPLATPPPPPAAEPRAMSSQPPAAVGPSIPLPGAGGDAESEAGRSRVQAGQRFRQSTTGMGRLATPASSARRPQAQATPPTTAPAPPASEPQPDRGGGPPRVKRGQTEADFDLETYVGGKDDWKNALAVEDEQLVDWSASDETVTNGEEISRKR
jgi:hypothetical protein